MANPKGPRSSASMAAAPDGRGPSSARARSAAPRDGGLLGRERGNCAAVEDLALDRSRTRARCRSAGVELVEARGQQRVDRRRDVRPPPAGPVLARPSRPSPRRTAGCRPRRTRGSPRSRSACVDLLRSARLDQLARLVGRQAARGARSWRSASRRPGRTLVEQFLGRARQSRRIGAPRLRSATYSIRSRNGGSPQWDVVEDDHERPARPPAPPAACGTPRRSVVGSRRRRTPSPRIAP